MANTSSRSGVPRRKQRTTNENEPEFIESVRSRAYALYESRGRADGYDLEDWLVAEQQALHDAGTNR